MLMNKIKTRFSIRTMLLGLLACSMMSCSDNLDIQVVGVEGAPHDPNQPVEVTDYSPKKGSAGQKMVVYGKNFGTDESIIRVVIGGTDAIVVSANGDMLYCIIPEKSAADNEPDFFSPEEGDDAPVAQAEGEDDGETPADSDEDARTVYVAVGQAQPVKIESTFSYIKAWKVRTVAGQVNEKNENVWLDGPFDNCGNFENPENFCVDPVNSNLIWISGDMPANVRLLDMENKTVTTLLNNPAFIPDPKRIRWVDFTHDGKHNMLIALDSYSAGLERPGVLLLERDQTKDGIEAFKESAKNPFVLIKSFFVNGVVPHPISNSLFFNCYSTTGVYKFPDHVKNPDLFGNPDGIYAWKEQGQSVPQSECQMQYSFGESGWEFVMHMHPTGKFMIGVHVNGTGFLSKAYYDAATDTFVQPGAFVNANSTMGLGGGSGYKDDVGLNARMKAPREGCFVYNPEYAGQEDEYDFYFTDSANHCIRKVTPQGVTTTFAGRGTAGDEVKYDQNVAGVMVDIHGDGYADGLALGEALFFVPQGITYSKDRNSFLVGDRGNKRIREIYYE